MSFGDDVFVGTGRFAIHDMVNCVFNNAPGYGEKLKEGCPAKIIGGSMIYSSDMQPLKWTYWTSLRMRTSSPKRG